MPSVVTGVADVVNLALSRIGYKGSIGDIYEGSAPARAALRIYGQTRDTLLRSGDWQFARRELALNLLKQAPSTGYFLPGTWDPAIHPPRGWIYEYTYPDDCVKIGAVKPRYVFAMNFDPQPHSWSVANDNAYAPPRRVILSNVGSAMITYTGRVTDPTTWDPLFVEAFAASLARRLAPLLNPEMLRAGAQDEAVSAQAADMMQG